MSKFFRMIAAVFAVIMMMTGFAGCSEPEPADEDEVLTAANDLIEAAVEVNRIFFWEGLPHAEPEENDIIDIGDAEYLELTEDYMYLIESDLIKKAEAVYTASFCEDIKKVAFEGVAVNDEEALYARYIVEQGVMKINRKLSEEGLPERIPDLTTIETVEIHHDTAIVSVEFTGDGKNEKQNVSLKLEESGWRLDTPTY